MSEANDRQHLRGLSAKDLFREAFGVEPEGHDLSGDEVMRRLKKLERLESMNHRQAAQVVRQVEKRAQTQRLADLGRYVTMAGDILESIGRDE